jgi:hypothetical protein
MKELELNDLKELVFQNFVNDAKATFHSIGKIRAMNWSKPANTWGGNFAGLPDCLTYNRLWELLGIHENQQ